MKLGILGQPCIDEIISPDGETTGRSLGGILYSLAAADRAMSRCAPDASLAALTWYSTRDAELLALFYDSCSHLDRTQGLWPTAAPTNRVQLRYSSVDLRSEHCSTILPPLAREQLSDLALPGFDALFINMISGFDLTLDTFEWLSQQALGIHIHLDVHALSLGSLSTPDAKGFGGGRQFTRLQNWDRWIAASHSVQMNLHELSLLGDSGAAGESQFVEDVRRRARQEKWKTRYLIVTHGPRGAIAYEVSSASRHESSAPRVTAIDSTGAGDVFGGVFALTIGLGWPIDRALNAAVGWASWNTELRGVQELMSTPLPRFLETF